jgi:hypothetical protein
MAQVVENLLGKDKVLTSNPSATKKDKRISSLQTLGRISAPNYTLSY